MSQADLDALAEEQAAQDAAAAPPPPPQASPPPAPAPAPVVDELSAYAADTTSAAPVAAPPPAAPPPEAAAPAAAPPAQVDQQVPYPSTPPPYDAADPGYAINYSGTEAPVSPPQDNQVPFSPVQTGTVSPSTQLGGPSNVAPLPTDKYLIQHFSPEAGRITDYSPTSLWGSAPPGRRGGFGGIHPDQIPLAIPGQPPQLVPMQQYQGGGSSPSTIHGQPLDPVQVQAAHDAAATAVAATPPPYDYGPTSRISPLPPYDYGPTSRLAPIPTTATPSVGGGATSFGTGPVAPPPSADLGPLSGTMWDPYAAPPASPTITDVGNRILSFTDTAPGVQGRIDAQGRSRIGMGEGSFFPGDIRLPIGMAPDVAPAAPVEAPTGAIDVPYTVGGTAPARSPGKVFRLWGGQPEVAPAPEVVAPVAAPPERTIFPNAPLESVSTRNALRPGVPGSGEATLINSGDYTGIPARAPRPSVAEEMAASQRRAADVAPANRPTPDWTSPTDLTVPVTQPSGGFKPTFDPLAGVPTHDMLGNPLTTAERTELGGVLDRGDTTAYRRIMKTDAAGAPVGPPTTKPGGLGRSRPTTPAATEQGATPAKTVGERPPTVVTDVKGNAFIPVQEVTPMHPANVRRTAGMASPAEAPVAPPSEPGSFGSKTLNLPPEVMDQVFGSAKPGSTHVIDGRTFVVNEGGTALNEVTAPAPETGTYMRKTTGRPTLGTGEIIPPPKPTGRFGRPIVEQPALAEAPPRASTELPREATPAATAPVPEPGATKPPPGRFTRPTLTWGEDQTAGAGSKTLPPPEEPVAAPGGAKTPTEPPSRLQKFVQKHKKGILIGGAAAEIVAGERTKRQEGSVSGPMPPVKTAGATATPTMDPLKQALRQGMDPTSKVQGLLDYPDVLVIGHDDPASGKFAADGVIDDNGNFAKFPDTMTEDQMHERLAAMQAARMSATQSVATAAATAPVSQPAGTSPPASQPAATAPVVPPVHSDAPVVPLATGTPPSGTTAAPAEGTPILDSEGKDTGLVVNSDGTVTNTSDGGGGGYTKKSSSSGGYSRGGYSGGGYSGGRYHKKKKKGSSTSSVGSQFWEGFPFNRPNSPIRQQILDAIAASKAEGQARKSKR